MAIARMSAPARVTTAFAITYLCSAILARKAGNKGDYSALDVVFDGVASDPLRSLAATERSLMGTLVVILIVTVGLALRAASVSRHATVAGSETDDAVIDAYARTSLLVLLCLLGLLALGLMYGNVLGA